MPCGYSSKTAFRLSPSLCSGCFLLILQIELVLKQFLRVILPFRAKELVGLRICATKLRYCGVQPVRQIIAPLGFQGHVNEFSCHFLHLCISRHSAWLAKEHYKGNHRLSGISEKCVAVGFDIAYGYIQQVAVVLAYDSSCCGQESTRALPSQEIFVQNVSCIDGVIEVPLGVVVHQLVARENFSNEVRLNLRFRRPTQLFAIGAASGSAK